VIDRGYFDLTELEDCLNIFEMIEFDPMFAELILEKAITKSFLDNFIVTLLTSMMIANGAFGGRCFAAVLPARPFI
jgi:hypothetical protein